MAESLSNKLQRFFRIKVKTDTSNKFRKKKTITPTDPEQTQAGEWKNKPLKFNSEMKRLWDWYESQNSDSSQTLQDRFDRYDDLDYMIYNDTVVSMAADLYADEASQADVQTRPIVVEAKKAAVKNRIIELLEKWGIDQTYIRETAWNICVYGEAFDINSIDKEEGIEDVTPVDVHDVRQRLEFKASEVSKEMEKGYNGIKKDTGFDSLINSIEDAQTEVSKSFKSYLLGFQVTGEQFLPPWAVNHFRNFSRKSEFWPYGRSQFINIIGPFRQLKTAKNLMALTRLISLPKEVYEVQVDETMSDVEKWEAVNEARQEFENQGQQNQNKDEFSASSEVWLPKDLLSHQTFSRDVKTENIADIEFLRDDQIIGTRVPKGFLITEGSSFGTSGQSLLQQYKPFGRSVYSIQSIILEEIVKLIKMQFLITGEFDKEFTDFELSMNFPVTEESQDHLKMKSDSLRLANDVISNIQSALGTRDGLPPDVIKMVFSKLTFLDSEEVEEIMSTVVQQMGLEDTEESVSGARRYRDSEYPEHIQEDFQKARERISEEVILEGYFDAKEKLQMDEGVLDSRHFVTSNKLSADHKQVFRLIRDFQKEHSSKKAQDLKE